MTTIIDFTLIDLIHIIICVLLATLINVMGYIIIVYIYANLKAKYEEKNRLEK